MAEQADGIPLVLYNPPHAKRELTPAEWATLKRHVPGLIGVKTNDRNSSPEWYGQSPSMLRGWPSSSPATIWLPASGSEPRAPTPTSPASTPLRRSAGTN